MILPSRRRQGKKNSYKATVNIRDVYVFYSEKYGTPSKGGCKQKEFRGIINEFNRYLADQIIKGEKVVLPFGLGCLEVLKKKQKYIIKDGKLDTKQLLPDWPKTWEYWKTNQKAAAEKKLLFYTNEHTDNYRYKFNWDKYNTNVRGMRNYSFSPSKLLSRRLKEHLLDPESIKNYPDAC